MVLSLNAIQLVRLVVEVLLAAPAVSKDMLLVEINVHLVLILRL
jgi:hypothetical protein